MRSDQNLDDLLSVSILWGPRGPLEAFEKAAFCRLVGETRSNIPKKLRWNQDDWANKAKMHIKPVENQDNSKKRYYYHQNPSKIYKIQWICLFSARHSNHSALEAFEKATYSNLHESVLHLQCNFVPWGPRGTPESPREPGNPKGSRGYLTWGFLAQGACRAGIDRYHHGRSSGVRWSVSSRLTLTRASYPWL